MLGKDAINSVTWSRGFLGNGVGPVVTGPFAGWSLPFETHGQNRLYRNTSADDPTDRKSPTLLNDDAVRSFRDGNSFRDITWYVNAAPEGYHDSAHAWVGGVMNDLAYAPSDPAFFLHAAFVDCLWEGMRSGQRSRGVDPRWVYPNDTVALGVGVPQPDGRVLGRADDSAHHATHTMYPFSPLTNMDGLSNTYTDVYYSCGAVPACAQGSLACGSPYLFCDVRTYRCAPKLRLGAMCTRFSSAPTEMETNPCHDSHCCNGVCTRHCPMGMGAGSHGALPRPATPTTPRPSYHDNQEQEEQDATPQDEREQTEYGRDNSQGPPGSDKGLKRSEFNDRSGRGQKDSEEEADEVRKELDSKEPNPFIHPHWGRDPSQGLRFPRPPWARRPFRRPGGFPAGFRPRMRGIRPRYQDTDDTEDKPSDEATAAPTTPKPTPQEREPPVPTPTKSEFDFPGPRLPFGPLPKDELYPRGGVQPYGREGASNGRDQGNQQPERYVEESQRSDDQGDGRAETKELVHELFKSRPAAQGNVATSRVRVREGIYRPTRSRVGHNPRFSHIEGQRSQTTGQRSHDGYDAPPSEEDTREEEPPVADPHSHGPRPHDRYLELYGQQVRDELRSFQDRNFDEQSLVRYVLFADPIDFKYKERARGKEDEGEGQESDRYTDSQPQAFQPTRFLH